MRIPRAQKPELPRKIRLKGKLHSDLGGEGDTDSGTWAEKVAQRSAGNKELIAAGDGTVLGASRRIQAEGSDIGEIVHWSRQRSDITHVVVSGIVAIEKVKEFDERRKSPAILNANGTAYTKIRLEVRSATELILSLIHI